MRKLRKKLLTYIVSFVAIITSILMINMQLISKNKISKQITNIRANTNKYNQYTQLMEKSLPNLSDGQVYVGYSKVCINPNPEDGPVPLAGYGNTYNRVADLSDEEQQYKQDLYATAVAVMDKESNIVIFVTCDLINLSTSIVKNIQNNVTAVTNIPSERIMISCTHTHSAPDTAFTNSSYPELVNSINLYKELLNEQIAKACSEAVANIKPADIYIKAVDIVTENGENALNFVRHYETDGMYADGEKIYSGDNHGSYYWDGTKLKTVTRTNHATDADSVLQMIKFDIEDDEDVLMVNWQTHPHITGSSSLNTISADLIASFRDTIEKTVGARVAYYTGASGNINWSTSFTDGREGIKGLSYSYDKSTSEKAYNTSVAFGEKLASYVINNYSEFEKVNGGNVNIQKKTLALNLKQETNSELLKNAKYCQKIWNSNFDTIAQMVTGEYNWGDSYEFPDGYNSSGAKLREAINSSASLKTKFIVSGNDEDGYTCKVDTSATRSNVNTLIAIIGAGFEQRIYSPYHADAVIRNYANSQGQTSNIEINAIAIGDISFAAVPYEMFDTNGKYIKENSNTKMTFVLELTNGSNGYFPSEYAYEYGCYEADTTRFEKGSAEKVATELVTMIAEASKVVSSIQVTKLPTKTQYIKNYENLDLSGGEITVTYSNGSTDKISLTDENISVEGFSNLNIGKNLITVKYEEKIATFEVEIINRTTQIEIETELSTERLTNQDITLTIDVTDLEIGVKSVTVNEIELNENNGKYTTQIKENGIYEIIVTDFAGNETSKVIEISNIDKIKPTIEVTYNKTSETNQEVIVTINANEELQEVEGWTISTDKKSLSKIYSQNVEEVLSVYDLAGNQEDVTIKVSDISENNPGDEDINPGDDETNNGEPDDENEGQDTESGEINNEDDESDSGNEDTNSENEESNIKNDNLNDEEESTGLSSKLPYAGDRQNIILIIIVIFVICSIILYAKLRKYKGIK